MGIWEAPSERARERERERDNKQTKKSATNMHIARIGLHDIYSMSQTRQRCKRRNWFFLLFFFSYYCFVGRKEVKCGDRARATPDAVWWRRSIHGLFVFIFFFFFCVRVAVEERSGVAHSHAWRSPYCRRLHTGTCTSILIMAAMAGKTTKKKHRLSAARLAPTAGGGIGFCLWL